MKSEKTYININKENNYKDSNLKLVVMLEYQNIKHLC